MPYGEKGEEISAKLNLIAAILLDIKQDLGQKMSVKERVEYLVKRGVIDDEDITAILDITRSHASKEKAMLKRGVVSGREDVV